MMAINRLNLTGFYWLLLLSFLSLPFSASPLPEAAADVLRSCGYSLSASVLEAASHAGDVGGWNATGTLFVPSDAAFKNHRIRHPPFSVSRFTHHATPSPPVRWSDLATLPAGHPIPTLSTSRRCLFLHRTPGGDPCLAAAFKKTSERCVEIGHPDLYFDGNLAIHGVDAVIHPTVCYRNTWRRHLKHLDRAVRELRRGGYGAVAEEMQRRRAELAEHAAVTVFAMRDADMDRSRYDLRRHVVPSRYRIQDLARIPHGTPIATMVKNATVTVGNADGALTVNGVAVDGKEIHLSGWAVVIHISHMFPISDDVADQVPGNPDYFDPSTLDGEYPVPGSWTDGTAATGEVPTPGFWTNKDASNGGISVAPTTFNGDYSAIMGSSAQDPLGGGMAPSPEYPQDDNDLDFLTGENPAPASLGAQGAGRGHWPDDTGAPAPSPGVLQDLCDGGLLDRMVDAAAPVAGAPSGSQLCVRH